MRGELGLQSEHVDGFAPDDVLQDLIWGDGGLVEQPILLDVGPNFLRYLLRFFGWNCDKLIKFD